MKTQTKHLMLSVAIMLFIVFISIPIAFLKIERLYPIMTWSCRLDCIYFFVALGIYIATYKPKERMQKAKKTMKHDYSYDTKEVDTINQKTKKKFKFKTSNDRLYDEAVNYFGKDSIKNRDKAAVIEDYLNEEGSMWKK